MSDNISGVATLSSWASDDGTDYVFESKSDAELVRRSMRSNEEAVAELFGRHAPTGWRFAEAITLTTADAEVYFAEGFVEAIRKAPNTGSAFTDTGAAQPFWVNLLAGIYRRSIERHSEAVGAAPPTAPSVPKNVDQLLLSTFYSLPDRWRAALWLYEVEDLSEVAIGSVLGVSAAVAGQLLTRGQRFVIDRFREAKTPLPEQIGSELRGLGTPLPISLAATTEETWRAGKSSQPARRLEPAAAWLSEKATRPLGMAVGGVVALGLIGVGVLSQRGGLNNFGPAALGRGPAAAGSVGVSATPGARLFTMPANVAGKFILQGSGANSSLFSTTNTSSTSSVGADTNSAVASGALPAATTGSGTPAGEPASTTIPGSGSPGNTPGSGTGTSSQLPPSTATTGPSTPPTTPGIVTDPVTVGPVSVPPVNVGPVTVGPVTVGPVSVPPVNVGPVTVPVVTLPSVSVSPVVVGPVTVGPVSVPPVTLPTVSVPPVVVKPVTVLPVTVPGITVPSLTVPSLSVPKVTLPTVTLPNVTVPKRTVPNVTIPKLTVPKATVANITVPSVTVPSVTVPSVTVPSVTVPAATIRAIKVPSVAVPTSTVSVPATTTPIVTTPIVTTPVVQATVSATPAVTVTVPIAASAPPPASSRPPTPLPGALTAGGATVKAVTANVGVVASTPATTATPALTTIASNL